MRQSRAFFRIALLSPRSFPSSGLKNCLLRGVENANPLNHWRRPCWMNGMSLAKNGMSLVMVWFLTKLDITIQRILTASYCDTILWPSYLQEHQLCARLHGAENKSLSARGNISMNAVQVQVLLVAFTHYRWWNSTFLSKGIRTAMTRIQIRCSFAAISSSKRAATECP